MMNDQLFEAAVYIERREILMQRISSGFILLMGNEESSMNYADNCYPFRQDSSFLYYAGLDLPGLALLLDCDNGKETLIGREAGIDDIIWMGPQPSLPELAGKVGINNSGDWHQLSELLKQAQAQSRPVQLIPPYRADNKIKLASLLGTTINGLSSFVSIDLIKAVVAQREVKSAVEIAAIEEAVNISVDMHLAGMRNARPGMKEYELAGLVEEVALTAGGRLSYPIILTINGQTLHNHYHGNTLEDGKMILCDAGAENKMHYAGDLTRTYPVGKAFDDRQRVLYQVVLNSLEHATGLLKPGARFIDIHREASIKLLEGLQEVHIVKGDPAAAVDAGVHTLFFQCGLGHMMGLDVHDMEDLGEQYVGYGDGLQKRKDFGWKSLRLGKALQPGFVLTVEPGLYFIPELIDRWVAEKKLDAFINYDQLAGYRNFGGIRIEDNYVITDTGSRMLGKPLAKSLSAVEALRLESFE